MENGDIEILGGPDFNPEQKLTPESEKLSPSVEKVIGEVAEALLKEREAHYVAGKGNEAAGLHQEARKRRELEDQVRGVARKFIEKYNKEPKFTQLWTGSKKLVE